MFVVNASAWQKCVRPMVARARWISNLLSALFAKALNKLWFEQKIKAKILLDDYQDIFVDVSGHFHIGQVHSRLHQLSCEQCRFQCSHSAVYTVYALPGKEPFLIFLLTYHRKLKKCTSCSEIASSYFPCCWYSSPRTLQQLAISFSSPLDFALAFTFNSSRR